MDSTIAKLELYLAEGKIDLLIKESHKILKKKFHPLTAGNLGLGYLKANKPFLAIKYFTKLLRDHGDDLRVLHNLALAYRATGNIEKAIFFYKKSIHSKDIFYFSFTELIEIFYEKNMILEAKEVLAKYKEKIAPDLLFFYETAFFDLKFSNIGTFEYQLKKNFKILKDYEEAIRAKKNNFQLRNIMKNIPKYFPPTNLTSTFHMNDIVKFQKKYSEAMDFITDQFNVVKKINISNSSKKIKIAYASSLFKKHTITRLFKNWIFKLDRNKFDISIIDLNSERDDVYESLFKFANKTIVTNNSFEQNIEKIRNEKFDYLVYLDFHISREAVMMSNFQLAKKQAVTWGHPVTSGSKYIDFFLSSELMENKESEKKYSEKLVKLKNLSIFFESPKFFLNENIKFFFDSKFVNISNLQSSFKITPHEDEIYAEIINKSKNIKIFFLGSVINGHDQFLKKRICKFLHNKSDESRIGFLPRCNNNDFLNYVHYSDFLIDCLSWSGGNTHLEALSLDKPIITVEGNSLKQNHTTGLLKRINMECLIAKNNKDYLEKILLLASSPNLISQHKEEIQKNKSRLYEDMDSIISLENFFLNNLE